MICYERSKKIAIQKGYNTAERIGTWKDYIVYSPVILPINGIVPPTGLPCFIVEKDNEYSWVSIMGPLSRPRSKILRVAVSRIILSSEASKVKLVGNLVA